MPHTLCILLALTFAPMDEPPPFTIGPKGPKIPQKDSNTSGYSDGPERIELTVTPAPEPVPALSYRFDVPRDKQTPGNSVPLIYRALNAWTMASQGGGTEKLHELYNQATESPLADFPVEDAKSIVGRFRNVFEELDRAYLREETNWDWRMEELTGTEWISFLIPETQDSRELGRLLIVKGKADLAQGDFRATEKTLQMSYHLARTVAEPPIIISGLVGIAIYSMNEELILDWIAIPNSPNLYWALANIRKSAIDLRPALEYELSFPNRMAPWLATATTDDLPPAVWKRRLRSLLQELANVDSSASPLASILQTNDLSPELADLGVTWITLRTFPAAKRTLGSLGYTDDHLSAMPVGQIMAIYQHHQGCIIADDHEKIALVPMQQFTEFAQEVRESLKSRQLYGPPSSDNAEPFPLFGLLGPGTTQGVEAQLRTDSRMAGLQVIEAIRMHAAQTGSFPKSLDEITIVPVPVNPRTGKPFEHTIDGDKAILAIDSTQYEQANWRIELTLKTP